MNAVLDKRPVPMKISNLQSGFQILSRLPLANSRQAALEINYFLDSLLQTPPQGEVYLQLLEQTRISLCFIEEELARCYINKALPLGDFEASTFHQVVATWLKAARAYSHCAQMLDSDSDVHAERLALILHRCIFYTGMVIIEHHRARQELPAGVWLNLHGYYASAEEWGIATLQSRILSIPSVAAATVLPLISACSLQNWQVLTACRLLTSAWCVAG
jgi:hypothetical protein